MPGNECPVGVFETAGDTMSLTELPWMYLQRFRKYQPHVRASHDGEVSVGQLNLARV